jgi:hypothetical protein
MNGFAFIVGHCVWIPPSAKAALAFTAWFFGAVPGMQPEDYAQAIAAQYRAAGKTERQAAAQIAWLRGCIASWRPAAPR